MSSQLQKGRTLTPEQVETATEKANAYGELTDFAITPDGSFMLKGKVGGRLKVHGKPGEKNKLLGMVSPIHLQKEGDPVRGLESEGVLVTMPDGSDAVLEITIRGLPRKPTDAEIPAAAKELVRRGFTLTAEPALAGWAEKHPKAQAAIAASNRRLGGK